MLTNSSTEPRVESIYVAFMNTIDLITGPDTSALE
jgi:hypothetical protein